MIPTSTRRALQTPVSPAALALREKILDGAAPVEQFAEAVDRSPRTVFSWIAQGLPTVYVGRTPYVLVVPGRDWLLSRRSKVPPRRPGRPRMAADRSAKLSGAAATAI
jgi:hypothetical protein